MGTPTDEGTYPIHEQTFQKHQKVTPMLMNARTFFDKVARMRQLQKDFFATRDRDILAQSKLAEKEIDTEIARVKAILAKRSSE